MLEIFKRIRTAVADVKTRVERLDGSVERLDGTHGPIWPDHNFDTYWIGMISLIS